MFQKDLLKGYRILVTGGGTGLGKAMSKNFLNWELNCLYVVGAESS